MQTIITKACKELAIKEVPSKRVMSTLSCVYLQAGHEHRLVHQ